MTQDLLQGPSRPMSIGWALSWQAARDPDRAALTMGEVTYTRRELDQAANRMARALAAHGVRQDDRVVVVLPTGPAHQITSFGLWKLGASVIPLSTKLVDSELAHLIGLADPSLVIGVEPGRVSGRTVLPPDFAVDPGLSDEPMPEVVASRWKAIASGGSTGVPKLLWENRSSIVTPTEPLALLMIKADDVVLHPAGAYHNATFSQTCWALAWGGHVILQKRFDPEDWLALVKRHRVRWAYLVPTMMSRILALPEKVRAEADLSSIEVLMHMAALCPVWVKAAWIDWLGPEKVFEVYAGTEGYGATLINGVEWLAHRGSVGKAPTGTEIRGEDGQALPPGEVGAIYFRPASDNDLGLSADAQTYGDMGALDVDGYLYLADRRTDMIVTGGANLYPAEIEAVLEQIPGVVSVAVIGLPDPDMGAKAHALLELEPGRATLTGNELAEFLAPRMSRTKHPYTFEIVTIPLRDDAGKIRRSRLRQDRLAAVAAPYERLR